MRPPLQIWPKPVRVVHWAMAALILGMLALGVFASNFANEAGLKFNVIQWHKSFGFVAFVLAVARLGLRAAYPLRPDLPPMPAWQRTAARASHFALYTLLIAVPISGWLLASASPFNNPDAFPFRVPNQVFGLFELPDPIAVGTREIESVFFLIHATLNSLLAALVTIHIGAALKHHFIDRDSVLNAMLGRR